jgi:diguanylate cyclase (GGDEF)-like protein/PAS domain S-box-containing protein
MGMSRCDKGRIDETSLESRRTSGEAHPEYEKVRTTAAGLGEKSMQQLRVDQTRLETQIGELLTAQTALKESRDRYADLYEFAPVGYLTLSSAGVIEDINLTGAAMLGVERKNLLRQRLERFITPDLRDGLHKHVANVLAHDSKLSCEKVFHRNHGERFHLRLDCKRVSKAHASPVVRIALTDVTERAVMLRALRERDYLLSESQRIASVGSWCMTADTNALRWSDESYRIFGVTPDTFVPTRDRFIGLIRQNNQIAMQDWIRHCLAGEVMKVLKFHIVRTDGEVRAIQCRGSLRCAQDETAARIVGTFQDITEHEQAEHQQSIATTAFDSQEGMTVTDVDGAMLKVNAAFTRITGYTSEEAVGQNVGVLKSDIHNEEFHVRMWQEIESNGSWAGESWARRKNGEVYPEFLTITGVKDDASKVTNYVYTFNDITLSKAAADAIEHLAYYDQLTQLPNRRLLLNRLRKALASFARSGNEAALLYLDLDNFKNLNDTLGHDIGDLLLQQVAERLTSCVRDEDTVARLGGDEFVVMLEDLSGRHIEAAAQVESVANKILAALNQPYQLATHTYQNSPSIGIALIRDHEHGVEELLKQADIAMYQSKKDGRNTIRFFDPQMQESIRTRVQLENDLRNALDEKQFILHLQIQVDSSSNPVGAEALIRWQHPERGLVSPEDFIPHSEESGLILQIGNWVLESACELLNTWQDEAMTRDLVLSVNVSARQFHQANFVTYVNETIDHHGIDPMRLKLELTESLLLEDIEDTIFKMRALNKIGVRLSLDDFGTGYSSLQYLKRLPLEQLKIDKSFIRDLQTDSDDGAIVSTIIAMTKNLNLEVIAEGVETEAQKQFLVERGCNHFQGYLSGRPMPIKLFEAALRY